MYSLILEIYILFKIGIRPIVKIFFQNRTVPSPQPTTRTRFFYKYFALLLILNEMNRTLGHFCAHIGLTGPGEPPEDGEMIEMTLSSRHWIRNSSPGGLRPSTLPLGHGGSPQY